MLATIEFLWGTEISRKDRQIFVTWLIFVKFPSQENKPRSKHPSIDIDVLAGYIMLPRAFDCFGVNINDAPLDNRNPMKTMECACERNVMG